MELNLNRLRLGLIALLCISTSPLLLPVSAQAESRIVLLAPSGTINDLNPTFKWSAIGGGTEYHVYLQEFDGSPVTDETFTSTACDISGVCSGSPFSLDENHSYRWIVSADSSVWSEIGTFNTPLISTPTITPTSTESPTPTPGPVIDVPLSSGRIARLNMTVDPVGILTVVLQLVLIGLVMAMVFMMMRNKDATK